MIKLAAIWEQPADDAVLDRWYREIHSRESILFVGPWLRRYWAYRSIQAPAETDRFNVVRYRLTEMWYDSDEARREAARVFYPLTPPPIDRTAFPNKTRIANIFVPAVPTVAYIDGWPRVRPDYLRWVFFLRLPAGSDDWFRTVHGPELAKLPGLRRFVCHRSVDAQTATSWTWMCETWFDDYAAWKAAMLTSPPAFTPPTFDRDYPFGEMISTFTAQTPDMDFLRDGYRVP